MYFLPEAKSEDELMGVAQGDADTSRNVNLDLGDFGTEGCGIVVTSGHSMW